MSLTGEELRKLIIAIEDLGFEFIKLDTSVRGMLCIDICRKKVAAVTEKSD